MAKQTFAFVGLILHPLSLLLMIIMGWMVAEWGGVYMTLLLWAFGEFYHHTAYESKFWEDK